jgi:hypothetical protein
MEEARPSEEAREDREKRECRLRQDLRLRSFLSFIFSAQIDRQLSPRGSSRMTISDEALSSLLARQVVVTAKWLAQEMDVTCVDARA